MACLQLMPANTVLNCCWEMLGAAGEPGLATAVPQRHWAAAAPFQITSRIWGFIVYKDLLLFDFSLKLFLIGDPGFTIYKLCSSAASQDDSNYDAF